MAVSTRILSGWCKVLQQPRTVYPPNDPCVKYGCFIRLCTNGQIVLHECFSILTSCNKINYANSIIKYCDQKTWVPKMQLALTKRNYSIHQFNVEAFWKLRFTVAVPHILCSTNEFNMTKNKTVISVAFHATAFTSYNRLNASDKAVSVPTMTCVVISIVFRSRLIDGRKFNSQLTHWNRDEMSTIF